MGNCTKDIIEQLEDVPHIKSIKGLKELSKDNLTQLYNSIRVRLVKVKLKSGFISSRLKRVNTPVTTIAKRAGVSHVGLQELLLYNGHNFKLQQRQRILEELKKCDIGERLHGADK